MIIDSENVYRSIAGQKEFSFVLEVINSNTSGSFNFGFSGVSGEFDLFKFNSGKIYDFNNRYVWSYNPQEQVNFSGNIGENFVNYFINDIPVCLFSPYQSTYYNHFYAKSINVNTELEFYLNGNTPVYELIFPETVMNGTNFTGIILNKNLEPEADFKIFSGDVFNVNSRFNSPTFNFKNISGGSSDTLVLSSEPLELLERKNVNFILNLQTNFGEIVQDIQTTIVPIPVYLIDFVTGFTGNQGLEIDRTLYKVYDYELRVIAQKNVPITVSLENISGHDPNLKIYEDYLVTGNAEGVLSNIVHGFDYITGRVTGFGFSETINYYGNNVTGFFDTIQKRRQYATGNIDYYYNLPLYGGSGFGSSPPGTLINGSGFKTGDLLETVFIFKTGLYSVDSIITGYYNGVKNTKNQTTSFKTHFTGSVNLNFLDYFWSGYSTGIGFTGDSNKIYGITGSNNFIISGSPFNTGTLGYVNYNDTIFSNQATGLLLKPLIFMNSGLFLNSGLPIASENLSGAKNAFTGENYYYIINSTGFVGINFTGYNPIDRQNAFYYTVSTDFETKLYPYIFDLEYSTDGNSWITADSRTGVNFYSSPIKIFELKTSLPKYIAYLRLNLKSGIVWPHQLNQISSDFYETRERIVTLLNSVEELYKINPSAANRLRDQIYENYSSEINEIKIGLKDFEIYSKKNVTALLSNGGTGEVVPNLCGYCSSVNCPGTVESFWISVNI